MRRIFIAFLLCLPALAQRTPRPVDSIAAMVAMTPSASIPDVVVVSTNDSSRLQFRYYPSASDNTNNASPYIFATSTGTGRWKEIVLTGSVTNITSRGTLTIPSGHQITVSTGGGIKGELYARNNDLTDLASVDPAGAGISHSQRVLYDGGFPLNRIYQWDAANTDSADSDAEHPQGVQTVIPDMEPWTSTPATAGRWIMLQ